MTQNYRCDPVPGTPGVLNGTVYQRMDDSGDGLYSTTINVKRPGTAALSVLLTKVGGFYGEYFNNAFLDGVPAKVQVDTYLDFDWGTGLITDEAADFASVQWFGRIRAPTTEEFTFLVSADDGVRIYIDGKLMVDRWDTCCEDVSFSLNLTQHQFYDTIIEYKEHQERAHFRLEWVSLSVPREVIPPGRVHYPQRVEGRVFQLNVLEGPTIFTLATAEGEGLAVSTAGKRSYFYVQSRDWDGRPLGNGADDYAISLVGPHEGGPLGVPDSGSFDILPTHVGGGQYLA